MSLEHSEVRDLVEAIIDMLHSHTAEGFIPSRGSSYSDQYFTKVALDDEHILGGLMLGLYGIASLYYNSVNIPHKRTNMTMPEFFRLLKHGGHEIDDRIRVAGHDEKNDCDEFYKKLLYELLRSVRDNFKEEEKFVFETSDSLLGDIDPFINMKSMLNLRRNAKMLTAFLDEADPESGDIRSWLGNLDNNCAAFIKYLTRDAPILEICDFGSGNLSLSKPLEFRKDRSSINDFFRVSKVLQSIADFSPSKHDASVLFDMPPEDVQAFICYKLDKMVESTAEAITFNLLLRLLLMDALDIVDHNETSSMRTSTNGETAVHVNGSGNICFVSSTNFKYDICLSHAEVLLGVDTDIVVRLYAKDDSSLPSSSQSAMSPSFFKAPVNVFNIEIDGPGHNYPQKKNFCILRDDYLCRSQSTWHLVSAFSPVHDDCQYSKETAGGIDVIRLKFDNGKLRFTLEELITLLKTGEGIKD